MQTHARLWWIVPIHTLAGVLLATLVLHPLTMVIYCIEFHPEIVEASMPDMIIRRIASSFSAEMWPMTAVFATLGLLVGMGSGIHARVISQQLIVIAQLDRRLGVEVRALIAAGESSAIEFKSSLRWDHVRNRCNKDLELVIAKTIAGFLNHHGGDLIIGVADNGSIVGIEQDYSTLRKKDRDGFELALMQIVKNKIGADACALLHIVFHNIEGHDICRVIIEKSVRPVYVEHDGCAHYYARTGNATSELDAKEALEHIARYQSVA